MQHILKKLFTKGGFGLLFTLLVTLSSCDKTSEVGNKIGTTITETSQSIFNSEPDCHDIDVSKSAIKLNIIRLEDELMKLKSKEDAEAFLTKYPQLSKNFFLNDRFPKGVVANNLYHLANDTAIATIYHQTQKQYKDIADIKEQF